LNFRTRAHTETARVDSQGMRDDTNAYTHTHTNSLLARMPSTHTQVKEIDAVLRCAYPRYANQNVILPSRLAACCVLGSFTLAGEKRTGCPRPNAPNLVRQRTRKHFFFAPSPPLGYYVGGPQAIAGLILSVIRFTAAHRATGTASCMFDCTDHALPLPGGACR
jgi:hypothetical protein